MSIQLSVITPVLNGIRYIESCILNVIAQKCAEVEHVIVDGSSTDGTVEIIKRYAEQYRHIRWVSEKDNGQSDAMNKGIQIAKGNVLGFLNVDDFYEKNVLNKIVELFKTLPEPSLLVGNCYRWNDQGEMYEANKPVKLGITDLMLGWDINPCPVNPSQYFYHKSLHHKIGLYNVEEHYTLDIDFLLRAVQMAHVTYRDEFWGNYRFLKGTKTFDDVQCAQRYSATLHKYEKSLPNHQKFIIALKRLFYGSNHLINRTLYFTKHPKEFLLKIVTMIDSSLNSHGNH